MAAVKVQQFVEQLDPDLTHAEFVAAYPHLVLVEVEAQGAGAVPDLGVTERIDSNYIQRQSRATADARLLQVVPKGGGEGAVLVGRAPHCDLVIDHPSVSKEHARFTLAKSQLTLMDLGSTNGTFVNGRRLEPEETAPVRPDDALRFGKGTGFHVMDADGFYHYIGVLRRFGL